MHELTHSRFLPVTLASLALLTLTTPRLRAAALPRKITPIITAPLTGAVFTTDVTGTVVNGNVYNFKADVFLNGGPQPTAPCTAASLPDDDYYFQVTNPAGTLLLSSDDLNNRKVTVLDGVIVSHDGSHAIGAGKCPGALSVGLAPYSDTDNPGGEYKVWVTPVGSYQAENGTFGFVNSNSKTDNFKIKIVPQTQVAISGFKFYDLNTNGAWDAGEPPIEGWRIEKTPPLMAEVTYTAVSGQYGYVADSNSGLFTITEIMPPAAAGPVPAWLATRALSGTVTVGVVDVAGPDFGNVCTGPGGAKPISYWTGCQAPITSADLALLRSLNLRNSNGSNFDPIYAFSVSNWLRNASTTNMAYMLSVELAVLALNVQHGFVNGGALIYAPGSASANAAGFAAVNAITAEANAELGLHGYTPAGNAYRATQELLKNILHNANTNASFVQAAPCHFDPGY